MSRKKIAILRGGNSNEYDVSLKTGVSILQNLSEDKYIPLDIFLDKKNVWHVRGVPVSPERALCGVDAVWIALHGASGEDGSIQRMLERFSVPYVGAGAFASMVCFNKELSKNIFEKNGALVPRHTVLKVSDSLEREVQNVFRTFPQPCIVKPVCSGSSVGVSLARSYEELLRGVKEAFQHSPQVLIEEQIRGKEATVGIVDGLRGEALYSLPPVEIIPHHESSFFDFNAKYGGKSEERCPGNFTTEETQELKRLAQVAHTALHLKHFSRSDFIVSRSGIYFIEANSATACGLTAESLLPKSLLAVGIGLPEFVDHVVHQALERRR